VDATFSRLTMMGASAMLLLALVVMWRRHVPAYIRAFRTQSLALAFVGAVVAWFGDVSELFLVAALILGLKGWVVPRILMAMEARHPSDRDLHPLVNTEMSLLVSGGLALGQLYQRLGGAAAFWASAAAGLVLTVIWPAIGAAACGRPAVAKG